MKLFAVSILGLGLGLAAMTASQAMPLAPLEQAASAHTIQVAGGCGPGWHRGPYGGCQPNWREWQPGWRACPPGWHLGPEGRRCWPN